MNVQSDHKKTLLDWALGCHGLGWCAIPIPYRSKKARIRWKRYQTERPDRRQVEKWFDDHDHNIAVVLGPVSNGLTCRDFDTIDGYESWTRTHPDLARRLPTAKTARGFHVYFLSDVKGIHHLADGELRGSGGYCLLPPSLHPEGTVYEWVNPPTSENLVEIDAEKAGFLAERPDVTEQTENTEQTEQTEAIRVCGGFCENDEKEVGALIEQFIDETAPTEAHTRNRKVFTFARALKSLPQFADAGPEQLRPYVEAWHEKALPTVTTKEFEETWIDFLKAWANIKYPKGEGPMAETFRKAVELERPRIAVEKYPEHDKLQILVSLCRLLQRAAGENPFFLSCRTAGGLMAVSAMQVSRWFFLLEADGILRVVSKGGTRESARRATRFRYIGDQEN